MFESLLSSSVKCKIKRKKRDKIGRSEGKKDDDGTFK